MRHRAITFASAAFFVTSLALASDTWILDASTSNARLFRGSRANSDSVNTGVARVTGKVKLDTNDLDASFFDLSIYPADEGGEHVLHPEMYLADHLRSSRDGSEPADIQVHQHSGDRERHAGSHRESYIDSRGAYRHSDAY